MSERMGCSFEVYAGSRYVDPTPPEFCDEYAVEGSEFCEKHEVNQ